MSARDPDDELRRLAIDRLKKRSEFRNHLTTYLLVNAMLVLVWFTTFRRPLSEERIRREIDRLS